MSEYQYYEFQAIDRQLTEKEMDELRSYSTRAHITPRSFVNDYAWGSFKGDENAWMEQYFDAFLYLANWGTHVLKLRLPSRALDLRTAGEYCVGDSASAYEHAGKIILSFASDEEEGGEWAEGEGILSSLVSVRSDLAQGDLRALYLGWLLCVQAGDLDDEELEPPIPPGLSQLSAVLEDLADFLRIDGDFLDVAARASRSLEEVRPKREEVHAWVASLPVEEKDAVLTSLAVDGDHALITELLHRFHEERKTDGAGVPSPRRTVGELLRAAETLGEERQRLEAQERAEAKARREQEVALAREKHLDGIVGREPELWARVEELIAATQPKSYDEAVRLLLDLRDVAARSNDDDFPIRVEALRRRHAKKPSLIRRLNEAGM